MEGRDEKDSIMRIAQEAAESSEHEGILEHGWGTQDAPPECSSIPGGVELVEYPTPEEGKFSLEVAAT